MALFVSKALGRQYKALNVNSNHNIVQVLPLTLTALALVNSCRAEEIIIAMIALDLFIKLADSNVTLKLKSILISEVDRLRHCIICRRLEEKRYPQDNKTVRNLREWRTLEFCT